MPSALAGAPSANLADAPAFSAALAAVFTRSEAAPADVVVTAPRRPSNRSGNTLGESPCARNDARAAPTFTAAFESLVDATAVGAGAAGMATPAAGDMTRGGCSCVMRRAIAELSRVSRGADGAAAGVSATGAIALT